MRIPDNLYELVESPVAWGDYIRSLDLNDEAAVHALVVALQSPAGGDDADWRLAELAQAAAQSGAFAQAIAGSRSIRNFLARADGLRSTATEVGRGGDAQGAVGLLMEAAMAAQAASIDGETPDPLFRGNEWVGWYTAPAWQKALSLARIAQALRSFGEIEQGRRIWGDALAVARIGEEATSRQDSVDSASVLWEIAEAMAVAGEVAAASDVAGAIRVPGLRAKALSGLAAISRGEPSSFAQFW